MGRILGSGPGIGICGRILVSIRVDSRGVKIKDLRQHELVLFQQRFEKHLGLFKRVLESLTFQTRFRKYPGLGPRNRTQGSDSGVGFMVRTQESDSGIGFSDRNQ